MSGPYRTPLPSIAEMLNELVAAGKPFDVACIELKNMIRDGAVTLLDFHSPPQTDEWLVAGAILVIDAFRTKSRSLPYLYPSYFSDGVVARRIQFEGAAGLSISPAEVVSPNRRFVSDDKLVAEALEGIRSGRWPNAHKANQDLADQAEVASSESTVRRLGGKIRTAMN
jgi:hypothetical protein